MAAQLHNFEETFTQLCELVEEQGKKGKGPAISFDAQLADALHSTTTPNLSDELQARLKTFEQKKSFLRFDGPAICLVISTVLQFPPSNVVSKVVYFFMDMLLLYKNEKKAWEALQSYLEVDDLKQEVQNRRAYIFSTLPLMLRCLLFDDSKHGKIRRLSAQLIVALCTNNAVAWRGLMEEQEKHHLFGSLIRHVDDHVLKILVADIVRHLRSENFDSNEIWDMTDEEAMDFPSSQEIKSSDLAKMLRSMKGMKSKKTGGPLHTYVYLVKDINIKEKALHSGRADTLLVIDDSVTVLVPNEATAKTTFIPYEFPIDQHMIAETISRGHRSNTVRMTWRHSKGFCFFKGKKTAVAELSVEFAEDNAHSSFSKILQHVQECRSTGQASSDIHQQTPTIPMQSAKIANTDDLRVMNTNGSGPEASWSSGHTEQLNENKHNQPFDLHDEEETLKLQAAIQHEDPSLTITLDQANDAEYIAFQTSARTNMVHATKDSPRQLSKRKHADTVDRSTTITDEVSTKRSKASTNTVSTEIHTSKSSFTMEQIHVRAAQGHDSLDANSRSLEELGEVNTISTKNNAKEPASAQEHNYGKASPAPTESNTQKPAGRSKLKKRVRNTSQARHNNGDILVAVASNDKEWEIDLQDEPRPLGTRKSKTKAAANSRSRELRDSTNMAHKTNPRKAVTPRSRNQEAKKVKSVTAKTRQTEDTAAKSRPRRARPHQVDYADPSQSGTDVEDELNTQHDGSLSQADNKKQSVSSPKLKRPATSVARGGVVKLPDHSGSSGGSTEIVPNSQSGNDDEIMVEDSDPEGRTEGKDHVARAGEASFSTLLGDFVPTMQRLPGMIDLDQEQPPFGDPAKFINNVNAAKSVSTSTKNAHDRSATQSRSAVRWSQPDGASVRHLEIRTQGLDRRSIEHDGETNAVPDFGEESVRGPDQARTPPDIRSYKNDVGMGKDVVSQDNQSRIAHREPVVTSVSVSNAVPLVQQHPDDQLKGVRRQLTAEFVASQTLISPGSASKKSSEARAVRQSAGHDAPSLQVHQGRRVSPVRSNFSKANTKNVRNKPAQSIVHLHHTGPVGQHSLQRAELEARSALELQPAWNRSGKDLDHPRSHEASARKIQNHAIGSRDPVVDRTNAPVVPSMKLAKSLHDKYGSKILPQRTVPADKTSAAVSLQKRLSSRHTPAAHGVSLDLQPSDAQDTINATSAKHLSEEPPNDDSMLVEMPPPPSPCSEGQTPANLVISSIEADHRSREEKEEQDDDDESIQTSPSKQANAAQDMTQAKLQRSQGLDNVPQLETGKKYNANVTMSLSNASELNKPTTSLNRDLRLLNVFDARDLYKPETKSVATDSALLQTVRPPLKTPETKTIVAQNASVSPKRIKPMPPPPKPTTKHQRRSELSYGNTAYGKSSKSEGSEQDTTLPGDDQATKPPPLNIKRIRQAETAPAPAPAPISMPLIAHTSTPQPFHEQLHASTSPAQHTESFTALELQEMVHNESDMSDTNDTTLVEPILLLRCSESRSPLTTSTCMADVSPGPGSGAQNNKTVVQQLNFQSRVSPMTNVRQSVQQSLTAVTQDILNRLEKEEQLARNLVQQYHNGCFEVLNSLQQNAESRVKHNATKLASALAAAQARLENTTKALDEPVTEDGELIEPVDFVSIDEIGNHGQTLLNMLDKVSC
ncbi:hypothetical protein LTR05_000822 [Lithohypha guttulata]|uniref:Uncharacterized protein n=1 Tax=Lithohypha guttulata TaxID=1690604 RepID=A0AAN7YEB3_9EURO|nr:hypothetical protein LTR05_000822 [Lithohypha guttulata]